MLNGNAPESAPELNEILFNRQTIRLIDTFNRYKTLNIRYRQYHRSVRSLFSDSLSSMQRGTIIPSLLRQLTRGCQ